MLIQHRCLRPPRTVVADPIIVVGEEPAQGLNVVPRGGFPELIVQPQDRLAKICQARCRSVAPRLLR